MSECVICHRPMAETAYADTPCAAQAAQKLREVAETTPEARNVAYGQTRGAHGASSSKPGSRSPGNDDALDALSEIQATLTHWIDRIHTERGTPRPWFTDPGDPLIVGARWLAEHLEWLRHQRFAGEAFSAFGEAASKLRFIVDGPSAKKYLGPCGALILAEVDTSNCDCGHQGLDPMFHLKPCPVTDVPWRSTCEGDVYVRGDARTGRCDTCKAEVDRAERQIWLTEQVRSSDLAWTARGIADALGINVKTLRAWATDRWSGDVLIRRAKLSTYWRDEQGRLVPWSEVARGERLHYVGDVKALAEQAADRRAAREAAEAERIDA